MTEGYEEGTTGRKLTRKQALALARVVHEVNYAFFNEETRRPLDSGNHLLGCKVATTRMMIMSVKAHRKTVRMVRIFTGNMVLPPIQPTAEEDMTTLSTGRRWETCIGSKAFSQIAQKTTT